MFEGERKDRISGERKRYWRLYERVMTDLLEGSEISEVKEILTEMDTIASRAKGTRNDELVPTFAYLLLDLEKYIKEKDFDYHSASRRELEDFVRELRNVPIYRVKRDTKMYSLEERVRNLYWEKILDRDRWIKWKNTENGNVVEVSPMASHINPSNVSWWVNIPRTDDWRNFDERSRSISAAKRWMGRHPFGGEKGGFIGGRGKRLNR